jgi:hypothetical protein
MSPVELPALEKTVLSSPIFFRGFSMEREMFDATINHLIEVSAVDAYTVIPPGRYRILLQSDGGADLICLDRNGKVPIHLTATQWQLLDRMKCMERADTREPA